MTPDDRDAQINTAFDEVFSKFGVNNASPLFFVGIGHAPGPNPGKFVVHLVGGYPLAEAFIVLKAITEDLAAKLGVPLDGVS